MESFGYDRHSSGAALQFVKHEEVCDDKEIILLAVKNNPLHPIPLNMLLKENSQKRKN